MVKVEIDTPLFCMMVTVDSNSPCVRTKLQIMPIADAICKFTAELNLRYCRHKHV